MSIGQVAERTGLSVHALRFYEREGILPNPVGRARGGRRIYTEDDVEWLSMCIRLRSSGMPLPALREYANLVRQGPGNEKDRLAVLRQHQDRVSAQIADLTESLDLISYKVRIYEERLAQGTADRLWSAPQPEAAEQELEAPAGLGPGDRGRRSSAAGRLNRDDGWYVRQTGNRAAGLGSGDRGRRSSAAGRLNRDDGWYVRQMRSTQTGCPKGLTA